MTMSERMKAPRRRDPRDDAANLANDMRAVFGLAPYRLPSIVAEAEEEEPPPTLPPHVRVLPSGDRILARCRPPGFWWRLWNGVGNDDLWRCRECGQAWRYDLGWDKVIGTRGTSEAFGVADDE
jgi:hypothetical protein